MIRTTFFLRKVSWMTMKKPTGETVMIMNLLIVKVGPIKFIMEIHSRIKIVLSALFLLEVTSIALKKPSGEKGTIMILNMEAIFAAMNSTLAAL